MIARAIIFTKSCTHTACGRYIICLVRGLIQHATTIMIMNLMYPRVRLGSGHLQDNNTTVLCGGGLQSDVF